MTKNEYVNSIEAEAGLTVGKQYKVTALTKSSWCGKVKNKVMYYLGGIRFSTEKKKIEQFDWGDDRVVCHFKAVPVKKTVKKATKKV